MYDILRLQTAIKLALPEYLVDIASQAFSTTIYPEVSVPVIILSIPNVVSKDTEASASDAYTKYGSLLMDITPIIIRSLVVDFNTVYANIYAVCDSFLPVPENENFSSFTFHSGKVIDINNRVVTFLTEWVSLYPRVV